MNAFPNTPTRPTHLPDYAELCLRALAEQQLGDKISLGEAFALLHYLDYRSTYDVDAWWQSTTTTQERQQRKNFSMQPWLDTTLYPDVDPPEEMATLADQIDFIARLCAAWDFGVVPYVETVTEIRQPGWREAVDGCRLLTSHTYHLLRRWHKLPEATYLGQKLAYICDDPNLGYI